MPFALGWSHAFSLALFVIHLMVVVRAITRPERTPASRVAWVAIIMFLPVIGVIIYVLLGETSIGSDGKPEPLCAIWEATCLPELTRCVLTGNGSLRKALMNLSVHLLDPRRPQALFNANTPQEASRVGLP